MIRILIDELGDGHDDIILKIEGMPTFTRIGDLFYIADFLELDPEKIEKVPDDLGMEYIKYFRQKLDNINDSETFIAFDISDQYIGGLIMTIGKMGLIKTTYATTDEIHGYEISNEIIDKLIIETMPKFDKEGEWLLSKTAIIEGLNWSADRIKKNIS